MKNVIVIVCDYFREYSLLNNPENDTKKLNCGKIMKFFFYFTHLKRSVIIILMENP